MPGIPDTLPMTNSPGEIPSLPREVRNQARSITDTAVLIGLPLQKISPSGSAAPMLAKPSSDS
ncbi:MAG TPA: hypothetical protein PK101_15380, partial [Thauera sp.]|nr:hypothetical protein [Thauera sp.]